MVKTLPQMILDPGCIYSNLCSFYLGKDLVPSKSWSNFGEEA